MGLRDQVDPARARDEIEALIKRVYGHHHAVSALADTKKLGNMPDVYNYARSVGMPHSRARLLADDLTERAAEVRVAISKIYDAHDRQVGILREVLSFDGART
jgi:hypothetical protein